MKETRTKLSKAANLSAEWGPPYVIAARSAIPKHEDLARAFGTKALKLVA